MSSEEIMVGLLRVAKCPNCDGCGFTVELRGHTEYVSRDMARDAGDLSLEGSVYSQPEPEQVQCQWCAERDQVIEEFDKRKARPPVASEEESK